jgi:hypothetical protein
MATKRFIGSIDISTFSAQPQPGQPTERVHGIYSCAIAISVASITDAAMAQPAR